MKIILWVINILIAFIAINIIFVLFQAFISLFVRKKSNGKQNKFYRWACVACSWFACMWCGVHPKLIGGEKLPQTPFLFVSNHRSGFDPLSSIFLLRKHNVMFISKPSNLNLPVIGNIGYAAGCLAIDRENDREALKTIITASQYISKGICSIGIYPEGTRNKGEGLLEFHAGSFKIAQKAKAPVVVAKTNNGTVEIIEVIPTDKVCSMKSRELANLARSIICEKL